MPTKTTTKESKSKPHKALKSEAKSTSGFAVIATGGKQYKVSPGDSVKVEKMIGDYKEGDTITFDKVLLKDDAGNTTIGEPTIAGAKVTGKLEKIGRAQKVIVLKYKQKSRYYKKNGHRQPFFQIKIETI